MLYYIKTQEFISNVIQPILVTRALPHCVVFTLFYNIFYDFYVLTEYIRSHLNMSKYMFPAVPNTC